MQLTKSNCLFPFIFLLAIILVIAFSINRMLNKWDRRDMKEAKNLCNCVKFWEKEMSPELISFYQKTSDIAYDYDRPLEEKLQQISRLNDGLSDEDAGKNREFARTFLDKNSKLYKCWNKEYSWDGENRGNNNYQTPGHKLQERGCKLAEYIYFIPNKKEVLEIFTR